MRRTGSCSNEVPGAQAMLRNLHNLRGISYLESLIAIAFVTLLLFAIGRLVNPEAEPTTDGPDFREALSLAQAELEVLATLAPEEVARQVHYVAVQ